MNRIAELIPRGSSDGAVHHGGRRTASRFPLQAEVSLLEPARASGYTINISEGGMRVVLDRAVSTGEFCLVLVRTAPDREFREHARVVWTRELADGCIAGLSFSQLAAA